LCNPIDNHRWSNSCACIAFIMITTFISIHGEKTAGLPSLLDRN
jgi:hypothetical protein